VEQIQAGIEVERNFEQLYKHFHPRLFAYLFRRNLTPERCEELTQDALFNAFNKISTFERRSRFSTWLYEIVHHLYINERRRLGTAKRDGYELPLEESPTPEIEDGRPAGVVLMATTPSPYEDAERTEQLATLREALDSLPPKMRRCALLRFQQDLKYREIAEVMKIQIDTVKAHIGQAKQLLQKRLGRGARALSRLGEDPVDSPSPAGRHPADGDVR
jgi:RNA polymerase sigma-70 factor (ECF subfamily)